MTERITEDGFIQSHIDGRTPIFCFLASSIRLEGTIVANDLHALLMAPKDASGDKDLILIFKEQIATIVPVSLQCSTRTSARHSGEGSAKRCASRGYHGT
jgi:sRNA-binding regulator protein Hfq